MEADPIKYFDTWYQRQQTETQSLVPDACCLSTNGIDGFPNARFVSLKEVTEDGFIITGPMTSRKGIEITGSEKVALTFWWPETQRQIRIQGNAVEISQQLADKYFSKRNRESKAISTVSDQGKELFDQEKLIRDYTALIDQNKNIDRPTNWGGYLIKPVRIEFLEFEPTRFHDRVLFEMINGKWTTTKLQP